MAGFCCRGGLVLFALFYMVKSDEPCDIEIENTLKTLLSPQDYPSMQIQALRRAIARRLAIALDDNSQMDKRNLEALARAGYIRTLPAVADDEPGDKRSIAALAKNGQLPQSNESKRGIESLARNGELHTRKEIQQLLDELYSKRNIGSLARDFNLPSYGKRNIAALARDGGLHGKRNVAALLRQDSYLNGLGTETPSMRAQYGRSKRQADYYEDEDGDYYGDLVDKRFLGSVAKSGWFRPSTRYQLPEKRHIGALARLGWLPTLRNVRRFNRSGRSTTTNSSSCRETAADGQTEDNAIAQDSLPVDYKRFLLQPAVDQILLKKYYMHPRTHAFISQQS